MGEYRLTRRALADLETIADYSIDHWGPRQTQAYLEKLEDRFAWLAQNPDLGKVRDDIATGYRSFPEGAHVIFYVLLEDAIAIIGVLHAAMDVTGQALDP